MYTPNEVRSTCFAVYLTDILYDNERLLKPPKLIVLAFMTPCVLPMALVDRLLYAKTSGKPVTQGYTAHKTIIEPRGSGSAYLRLSKY